MVWKASPEYDRVELVSDSCLVPVPIESRRVKLQGILADLRDVDGLPPKVTGPPPGTPQPRPHEGKRPFHPGPVPRGLQHLWQRVAAEPVSPGQALPIGCSLPVPKVCLSVSVHPSFCLFCPVHLSLPASLFAAVILVLFSPCLSLSHLTSLCLSPGSSLPPPSPPPTRFLWLLLRRLHHGHYRGRGGEPGGLGRSHRHQ